MGPVSPVGPCGGIADINNDVCGRSGGAGAKEKMKMEKAAGDEQLKMRRDSISIRAEGII